MRGYLQFRLSLVATVLLALSAILWSGAFAWFAIVYAPLLLRPRQTSAA